MNEKLYNIKEVAAHFRVTNRTIMNWLRDGKIHGTRPGLKWLFTETQIKEAVKSNEVGGRTAKES